MDNDPNRDKQWKAAIEGYVMILACAIVVAGMLSGCFASPGLREIRNELRNIRMAIENIK